VPDDRETKEPTPVERYLARRRDDTREGGPQIERSRLQRARTLEGYLTGSSPPRWMERLAQVDHGTARERDRLADAHRALREACAGDPAGFAERWRATVERWVFDPELNELIAQHNEWYPVERRLAVDPRTRDYVLVNGRSYRRPVLDARWALAEFPVEDPSTGA
jgi:hypothetical protein